MSCHISKFADMAESFMRREEREFHGMTILGMTEECHTETGLRGCAMTAK